MPEPGLLTGVRALLAAFVRHAGRRPVLRALAGMVGGALLEGVGLAMLVPLLVVLGGRGGGTLQVATNRAFAFLGIDDQVGRAALLLGGFVVVILVRAAVLAKRDAMLMRLELGFVDRQRSALLAALARARWSDVAGLRHARVLQALDDNIERTAAALHLVLQLATSTIMLAVQGTIVLMIAPVMALFAVALIAVGGALLLPVLRRAGRLGRSLAWRRAELSHGAAQLLGGLKVAMAQNLQHAFIAEFEATARAMSADRVEFLRRFSRSRITGTTVGGLAGAAIVLVGVAVGTPVVALIAAVAVFTRMIGPATTIGQSAQQIAGFLPGFTALDGLRLELERWRQADAGDVPPPPRAAIRFDRVTYLHGPGAGLTDVSLAIEPGEVIGIVGSSGAGKTTFVDLLAGLLVPQSGAILVGGFPLVDISQGWRDRIAYVGQDSFLFNDTLRRNLTLGLAEPSDAAMWAALERVGAAALVRTMPDGLETVVAERGARLSGGQRQRIAIARALLRRPDLLILDEATNAIDLGGEAAIFDALAGLTPRPTIIVVAHRAETLRTCDRLLRFEGGRLVPRPGPFADATEHG